MVLCVARLRVSDSVVEDAEETPERWFAAFPARSRFSWQ